MAEMLSLLREIYPLRMAPVSAGLDRVTAILCRELPFKVHEYPSGLEHNGWMVPQKWEVRRAEIRQNGKLIYDGLKHPLGVIGYSTSFEGKVSLEELKKHLFYHPGLGDALVYHCDQYYKPWRRDWGFSMPKSRIDNLAPGHYEVFLETIFESGSMKVCDYFLPGETEDTIVFNAHNCHAGQANDDISGVVVGMELMKRLARGKRRYSYRLVVAPEHLGTVFFLAGLSRAEIERFKYGIFLEMMGNDNRLAFQETFTGQSDLDRAAYHYLSHRQPEFESFKFREFVGNDETVWEAPGVEVPMISLCRYPYAEYHSDRDDDTIILESRLEEAVEVAQGIAQILETNCVFQRKFDGLIALSNPKYDLYIDDFDPSLRPTVPEEQSRWKILMDCLPRYFDSKTTVLDIAEKHGLFHPQVYDYLRKFEIKGLIDRIFS